MQKFNKKPIALAVGAALTAVAGGAVAQTTVAVRTSVPAYLAYTGATPADKQALFSAKGYTGNSIRLKFAVTSDSASTVKFGDTQADSVSSTLGDINGNISGVTAGQFKIGDSATSSMSQDTHNHLLVYATNGTTTVSLANRLDSATGASVYINPTANASQRTIQIDFQSIATGEAVRVDSATGKVLYTNDSGATWLNIKVRGNTGATALGLYSDKDTGVGADGLFTATSTDSSNLLKFSTIDSTDVFAGSTMVPQPTLSTYADSTGLVSGIVMETYGTNLGTVAAANLRVYPVKPNGATETTWNDSGDSTTNITVTPSTSGSKVTISFTGATANWTNGDSVADANIYTSKYFNTGIKATNTDTVAANTVPFRLNLVNGQAIAYGAAFAESTGSTAYLMKFGTADTSATVGVSLDSTAAVTDGAAPVVLSATHGDSTLKINFSEPIKFLYAGTTTDDSPDVQAILENIAYGTAFPGTTLAAANFNAGGTIGIGQTSATNTSGVGTLQISGVPSAFLNSKLLVAKRITLPEPGETGYTLNDSAATTDTAGLTTDNNETLTSNATVTVAAAANTLAWDQETQARAYMKSNSTSEVEKIVITWPYKVNFDTTAVIKDHIMLRTLDSGTVTPESFTTFLDSTMVTIDANGALNVTMPTTATRSKLKAFEIAYDSQWGDGKALLQFTDPADSTKKAMTGGSAGTGVSTGTGSTSAAIDSSEITMPYYVTASSAPLYTMEAEYTLTGVSADSRVTSYLAKWLEVYRNAAYDTQGTATFQGGSITDPGNKKITSLELEHVGTAGAFQLAVVKEANKSIPQPGVDGKAGKATDKPGNIKAYVQLASTNDQVKGGAVKGTWTDSQSSMMSVNSQTDSDNWLQAHAKFSLDPADLGKTSSVGGKVDPVYEVDFNPVTGDISGRLTGKLRFTLEKQSGKYRGLTFVTSKGDFDSSASNAAQVSSVVGSGGKTLQLIGIDPAPTKADVAKGAFLLSVLEEPGKTTKLITSADPGASNHMLFQPNLITGKDGRTKSTIDVAKIVANKITSQTSWMLYGVGSLDRAATAQFTPNNWARQFVSLDSTAALPFAVWQGGGADTTGAAGAVAGLSDSQTGDLALTMLGNKTGVASEGTSGDTLSTIAPANTNVTQFAFAWSNEVAGTDKQYLFHLTKAAAKTLVPAGWSLISAPATMPAAAWCSGASANNCVTHMLKVGKGYTTPVTWVVGDTGTPTLTSGEPIFVFVKGALSLN